MRTGLVEIPGERTLTLCLIIEVMIVTSQLGKFGDLIFVLDVKNKEFLKGLNLTELGRLRLDLIIELVNI